jgi:hypothetical protein
MDKAEIEEKKEQQVGMLIKRMFSNPVGQRVLNHWLEQFVFVENLELNPGVEGARAFVLRIRDIVYGLDDETDEEEQDGQ